jgi:hypothetical protein
MKGSLHLNVVVHDGDQYCNCAVVLTGISDVAHLHVLGYYVYMSMHNTSTIQNNTV